MNDATLYPPSRGLWVWLRTSLRQYLCGRRFGHFPVAGTEACARCGSPAL